ncbi:MAG: UDP-N-acetylmuramoyl-tripeptide--D-alanyl-D-alanine ligase [Candidatus Alcyoniella australis]|nr:UDP-N-acetylmuramoyl-tripeptide--D-alanyl-D-alanine ligase [Candidatus Alcyoniella australis]
MRSSYFNIGLIVGAANARPAIKGRRKEFSGISTDTRTLKPGELFVALKGPNFDGHKFLDKALERGAGGLMVHRGEASRVAGCRMHVLEVDDTLYALGEIARQILALTRIPVVGITGSVGKTTCKEMLAAVLEQHYGREVLRTRGNFNNLIGLPLTVFNLKPDHPAAVLEMGMNRVGEISRLAQIASPDIGVVTNISPVHLETLKTLAAVARAKGELFDRFGPRNTAVINRDDRRAMLLVRGRDFKVVTFGKHRDADVRATQIRNLGFDGITAKLQIGGETLELSLSTYGAHSVYNALAAAAAAHVLGASPLLIRDSLEAFKPQAMRSRIVELRRKVRLIDDTYNANPRSMLAALEVLQTLGENRRTVAVLGEMLELGSHARAAHQQIGVAAGQHKVDRLLLLGEHARDAADAAIQAGMSKRAVRVIKDREAAVQWLADNLEPGDVVLVKGSRGMRMELIVRGLKKAL